MWFIMSWWTAVTTAVTAFLAFFFLYIDLNDSDVKTVLGNPMLGGCWCCSAAPGGPRFLGKLVAAIRCPDCSLCSPPAASPVPPDPGGRIPASGPAGAGRGLQHGGRPALPRLAAHHLPRDRCQEPLLRPVAAQHADGAVRDRRHPGGHRGDDG